MKQEHLETTRATGPSLGERLVRNLDLLAALAALIPVALHFVGFLYPLPAASTKVLESLKAEKWEVEKALKASRFDLDGATEQAESVAARVRARWLSAPGEAPPVEAGATHPVALVEAARLGEANAIRFMPPKDTRGEAERGSITISWIEHEDNNVPLAAFVILRAQGNGPFQEHARVEPNRSTFIDREVEAGASYTYRVVAVTDDAAVPEDRRRSEPSSPVTAVALSDFKISLEEADSSSGTATFLVEKWHQGSWWSKRFAAAVGEAIGSRDEGSGVDYTTGQVLKSLASAPQTETRSRLEVIFDPEGRVSLQGGVPVTEEVTSSETYEVVSAELEGGQLPPATLRLEKR